MHAPSERAGGESRRIGNKRKADKITRSAAEDFALLTSRTTSEHHAADFLSTVSNVIYFIPKLIYTFSVNFWPSADAAVILLSGCSVHTLSVAANSWITSLKERSTQLVPYGTSAVTANCPRSWPLISATRLWRSDSNYCRRGRVSSAAASTAPSVSLCPAMCAASKRFQDEEEQSCHSFSVFLQWKLRNVLVGDYSELDIIRSN